MKNSLKKISMWAMLMLGLGTASAQYVPTHPKYVTYISGGKNFAEYFPSWQPGQQLSEDENFFISRVKLKPRFENKNSQVIKENTAYHNSGRKFSLCTPMGISDTYWQTLPRYVMDGDNFGLWSYVDYQDGWSQSWIRNVGAYSDVCHKNGVQNSGGVIFFDSWGGDNTTSNKIVNMITTKSGSNFTYLEKFCQFLRYYGIDGVTFNPEGTVPNAAALQDFFIAVREKMATYGLPFHVCWYGTSANGGSMDLGSSLTTGKSNWYAKNRKAVCDVYFLNYDWSSAIKTSMQVATNVLNNTSNLFGGYDIQGNWLGRGSWVNGFKDNDVSICFWGNHTTDMIYQNSTEWGSADEGVQANYLVKQEQVFCGGNRNVANLPAIKDGVGSSSTASMKSFHGIASMMPARSSLQELPFITRFSLGNGKVFRNQGQETFKNKWYSLSSQDYLPTWRWWITNDANVAPADPIECSFTFDDSWYAGSCMTMSGATAKSNVRLFKTNFQVSSSDDVTFTYKLKNGTDSHARLFWSFVGSESTLHYADIPAAATTDEWAHYTATAGAIGMAGNVAVIGLSFSNTASDYKMLVGEFGIIPQKKYSPVKPTITKADILQRSYNGVSYKLIWDCGKSAASKADAAVPTYNSDVDTWYFEVYSQMEGQDPVLDGITTSWAHYIVGANASPEVENYRFGVRAVAPNGKDASEIAWSDWKTTGTTYIEGVTVDRPVIKAGETFTVKYDDPLHPASLKWQIVDASGKDVVTPATNATSITGSISQQGTYDLVITNTEGDGSSSTDNTSKRVLSASAINTNSTYIIYTEGRGGLTVTSATANKLAGTNEEGVGQQISNTNTLQHFKFVKQGSSYYLYSVATSKYVSKTNTLTTSPTDPILFDSNTSGNTVRLYFDATHNINIGGSNQVTFDNWTKKDEGNSFIILPTTVNTGGNQDTAQNLIYRGLIQVSPDETGSVPELSDFTAERTTLTNEQPTTNVSFNIAHTGEGKVSRGLQMQDAYQFRIPKEALPASQQTYSVGFWIKPEVLAHSKYGTNLINKRNIQRSWPHNNWGAFWVIVWPEWKNAAGKVLLDDNVISYTMYNSTNAGGLDGNTNIHETPFYSCVTDRQHPCGQTYALKPGTWSHVMITYDGSSQSIFFNGKLAVKTQTRFIQYDESPIYIGGSNVYHAGIKGIIDDVQVWHKALNENEVQQAMKGYDGKAVPSELKAYYTFENVNPDNTFPNLGNGGSQLTGAYVGLNGAGENTAGSTEEIRIPDNGALGNAGLPGTLSVTTTAAINAGTLLTNATMAGGTISANAASLAGNYDVTVTLSNMWGESKLTKNDYITNENTVGINHATAVPVAGQGTLYNVAGQRVNANSAQKGVYIVGGKRIIK